MANEAILGTSTSERNWAAIAHASALLTLGAAIFTGGAGGLLMLGVPLALYLAFRSRSRYVAFHALQATVFQSAAMVIYLAGLAVGAVMVTVTWIIAAALSFILVGLALIPMGLIVTFLLVAWALVFPFTAAIWAAVGAWKVYHDQPFEYGRLGEFVARHMEATATVVKAEG